MPTARPRALRAAGILAAALAAGAGARAGETTAPPSSSPRGVGIPGGALVAQGNPPDLTFLYTGDVVGYIEPCG